MTPQEIKIAKLASWIKDNEEIANQVIGILFEKLLDLLGDKMTEEEGEKILEFTKLFVGWAES